MLQAFSILSTPFADIHRMMPTFGVHSSHSSERLQNVWRQAGSNNMLNDWDSCWRTSSNGQWGIGFWDHRLNQDSPRGPSIGVIPQHVICSLFFLSCWRVLNIIALAAEEVLVSSPKMRTFRVFLHGQALTHPCPAVHMLRSCFLEVDREAKFTCIIEPMWTIVFRAQALLV